MPADKTSEPDPNRVEPLGEAWQGLAEKLSAVEAFWAAPFLLPVAALRTLLLCYVNPKELASLKSKSQMFYKRMLLPPFTFWVVATATQAAVFWIVRK